RLLILLFCCEKNKMAEANVSVAQDQFSCSVCLETLKDPVSLPCGHSYCMGCIKSHWDQDDRTGVYSCPQCRQTFSPRPVLGRNTLLAEVVEKLRKRGSSTPLPPPAHSPAGPGDVLCDFCSRRKMRAVKSCLVCLASYCQTHLQPHYEAPAFKKHRLTSVSRHLQEICPDHQKLREVYCRTDQTCVCLLCSDKDHRSHDTVSTETERAEKQKQLGATQRQTQQRLEEREKELQELRQAVESLRSSGRRAVEDSERVFNELVRSVLRLGSQVKEQIEAGEREAVGQTERHIEELEQEIAELRRRDAELSQLSHTEDHIHFLQTFQALSSLWPGVSRKAPVSAESTFGAVRRLVSELKELTEDLCRQILVRIADAGGRRASPLAAAAGCQPGASGALLSYPGLQEHRLYKTDPHPPFLTAQLWAQQCHTPPPGGSISLCVPSPPSNEIPFLSLSLPVKLRSPSRSLQRPRGESSTVRDAQHTKSTVRDAQHAESTLTAPLETHSTPRAPLETHSTGVHTAGCPCMREDTAPLSCQLTLDPNTAHRHLCLSEGNRRVTWSREPQQYPDHPERFDHWQQVLCREGLSGTRCYWEVEWSGGCVAIGVMYRGISRKGRNVPSHLGHNDQSWSLCCSGSSCSFWHNKEKTAVAAPPSSRIGVCVDHRAGTLSFYSVSTALSFYQRLWSLYSAPETMSLLHRVQTTFSEPLYAGFMVGSDCSLSLPQL
uniref:Uncharacterized protein n=1 Tax=Lepisosteus oculatus TaxID=7918 RepID=W5NKM0_LEPOC